MGEGVSQTVATALAAVADQPAVFRPQDRVTPDCKDDDSSDRTPSTSNSSHYDYSSQQQGDAQAVASKQKLAASCDFQRSLASKQREFQEVLQGIEAHVDKRLAALRQQLEVSSRT